MKERCFLGIDPGLSGAVAVLCGEEVFLHDTPTRKGTRGHVYLAGDMADLLLPYSCGAFAVLEEVSLRPGESGRNGLKIGVGRGLWEGILAGARIAYEVVTPQAWKSEFRLIGAPDKAASRARAQELFPDIRAELGRRRPDFSEALLMALYAKRRWQLD